MWSVARYNDKMRPEFVMVYTGYGIVDTTTRAQLALRYTDLRKAEEVAKVLGDEWFTVAWTEVQNDAK